MNNVGDFVPVPKEEYDRDKEALENLKGLLVPQLEEGLEQQLGFLIKTAKDLAVAKGEMKYL